MGEGAKRTLTGSADTFFLFKKDYRIGRDHLFGPDGPDPFLSMGLDGVNGAAAFLAGTSITAGCGYGYRQTVNTSKSHHGTFQYITRNLNAEYEKFILSDYVQWGYGLDLPHGGQTVNALYFDGSLRTVEDAWVDLPKSVDNELIDESY